MKTLKGLQDDHIRVQKKSTIDNTILYEVSKVTEEAYLDVVEEMGNAPIANIFESVIQKVEKDEIFKSNADMKESMYQRINLEVFRLYLCGAVKVLAGEETAKKLAKLSESNGTLPVDSIM